MSNLDPEYLLGGYATGTLTPEERALLLQAALKDQALFEALMDEEALRELLADPGARKHLLAALPQPRKPLLLRPQFMAMAAGLVLVVAAAWMLERTPVSSFQEQKVLRDQGLREGEVRSQERPPEPASPGKIARAGKKASPGVAPRSVEAGPPDEAPGKPSGASAAPVPPPSPSSPAAMEASKSMDVDALGGGRPPAPMAAKSRRMEAATARPEFRLERSAGGLEVLWSGRGHLYVLKRGPAGVELLSPAATRSSEEGGLASRFEFALGGKELVDVYLLPEPTLDPLALPPEAPAGGLWRRIAP